MAAAKLDEYIRGLTAGGLMTAEGVQAFIDGLPIDERPQDGKRSAEQLVRHNRLTAFQAQAVYLGKESVSCSGMPRTLECSVCVIKIVK